MRGTERDSGKPYLVPYHNYGREYAAIHADIDKAIQRVLRSGVYREGSETSLFEQEWSARCGVRYAVTACSCQDALFLALTALGIGRGDEVISVANVPIAVSAPVSHVGASPVWVDIDERTYTMAPEKIAGAVTTRTKAILVPHLYGHPADMDAIGSVARKYGLKVVVDAATAAGAEYKGQAIGKLGDAVCFSHAPSKILGNYGDGGSVVTDSPDLAEAMRSLFIYRDSACYKHVNGRRLHVGFRYRKEGYHIRMGELTTSILRVKMCHLPRWVERRREIAHEYSTLLDGVEAVLPYESPDVLHAYRNYTIRVKKRDQVRESLARRGVETAVQYAPPLHLQPAYAHREEHVGRLPVTERVSEELINLPLYPELTRSEIEHTAESVWEAARAR